MGSFLGLQFCSIDLPVYHCTNTIWFLSVIQLEVKDGDFPRSSFIVENSFHCPGFFVCLVFVFVFVLLFQMNL